jgi:antitoxin VapB
MIETRVAKFFKDGGSQAVRLPAEFRFEGDHVYVTRDDAAGDVVILSQPGIQAWNEFFDLLRSVDLPADYMAERPLNQPPQAQGIFDDERTINPEAHPLMMLHLLDTATARQLIKRTVARRRGWAG